MPVHEVYGLPEQAGAALSPHSIKIQDTARTKTGDYEIDIVNRKRPSPCFYKLRRRLLLLFWFYKEASKGPANTMVSMLLC
jgi:hypothetical protein